MKHITIKRAEQADVDAIMQLMQEAVDARSSGYCEGFRLVSAR